MLLPSLLANAREWERDVIYFLPIPIGALGYVRAEQMATSHKDMQWLDVLSIGAFMIIPLIGLIVGILLVRRSKTEAPRSVPTQGPLARV